MSFINGVVFLLFIIFMVFIFGGYHKNKSAAREAEFEKEDSKIDNL